MKNETLKTLPRQFGTVTATALVVANMVGAGIFTTSGKMAGFLPDPLWVLVCWVLGGVIALTGALCYAELATRMPMEGGEYVYLKRLFHPSLGFLTGWTSFFVGFSAPIALSALGFSAYFFSVLKNLGIVDMSAEGADGFGFYGKLVAVSLIVVFSGMHYLGGRTGPQIQNVLTALKVLLILGLSALGLLYGDGGWAHFAPVKPESFSLMAFGSAMMMVMFSFSGWNASAYIAGELKNPKKTLPVSLVTGTFIVIVLYLAINVFYFYAAPYDQLKGSVTVAEIALNHAFGNNAGEWLSAVIGIVLLSSLSAFIMIGPRVYYAMACDGLFFKFAGRVHSRYNVPSSAVLVQGGLAVLMVIVGSFEQLLVYVGFALGIFPWLAVVGLFKARKLKIGEDSAAKVWGFPVVPIFFLTANVFLMTIAYISRPLESTAAIVTVLLGIPCYHLWIKTMGKADEVA